MSKLLVLSVLLISALAFNIQKESSPLDTIISAPIKAINWPFTTCGDGHWTIEKLTLSSQPVRNSNDSITVVIIWLFSWGLLVIRLVLNWRF
jgi:hypothetical protein